MILHKKIAELINLGEKMKSNQVKYLHFLN